MKKTQSLLYAGVLATLGLTTMTLISCRRNKELDKAEREFASDMALAETSFQDLKSMADEAASGQLIHFKSGEATLAGNCATVIWDTTATPKTITIDFGTVNCLCLDGRYRRGQVIITYTGPYKQPGTVITITPQNYFVNDNQIQGQKVVTNQGPNAQGQPVFSIVVNGTVIKTDGGTISWQSHRERTWIAGYDTPSFSDDEYSITGSAQGVNAQGNAFTLTILTPLVRSFGCKWFKSGTVKLERTGKPEILIDYGNGACDGQIQITRNGQTFTIQLG
ncbi:MAG: hypothetical protein N2050_01340 [Flavobacteriales bacterium]|nr:hypothetical protein [Flavobacteriales bacterium]